MLKSCAVLLCAVLVGCNSGTTPPNTAKTSAAQTPAATAAAPAESAAAPVASTSDLPVPQKLAELAGSSATDCGQIKKLAGEEVSKAGDCAMSAAKAKKAFHVEYDMPGLAIGVAGNSAGKLFAAQSAGNDTKNAKTTFMECPAELRVAQSGRVTCMPTGSMGLAPGADNPHASGGASPHGGFSMPPAGTPNPHAAAPAAQKSH